MNNDFEEVLNFLGFTDDDCEWMAEKVFTDFEDFLSNMHEELDSMISGFIKRLNYPIAILIKRRKLLHDLRNRSGNFNCRGMETAIAWPSEERNTEEDAFAAMKLAQDRAKSRKSFKEKTESINGPGKFDNTDYAKWRKAPMNHLHQVYLPIDSLEPYATLRHLCYQNFRDH